MKARIAFLYRAEFWEYCTRAAGQAKHRAKKAGIPFGIDALFLDQLFVEQEWRCAVSGLLFNPPVKLNDGEKWRRDPLGPSLDRIVPELGYVPGNVRIVNNLVNSAMQEWGLEPLLVVLSAMTGEQPANLSDRRPGRKKKLLPRQHT